MKIGLFFIFLTLVLASKAQRDLLATADDLLNNGNYAEAYSEYKVAADSLYKLKSYEQYTQARFSMVSCQLQDGHPFYAKTLAENTLRFIDKELNQNSVLVAKGKVSLASSYLSLGRNDNALDELTEAKELFQENTIDRAFCYNELGIVYWNNGNKALAIQYHEQALDLRLQLLGKTAVQVGDSYNNLGLIYLADAPFQSLIYFNRAKAIYEEKLGNGHQKTASLYTNLALVDVALGNIDQADELLEEVQLIYQTQYQQNHPNQAFILSNIGRVKEAEGKLDEGISYYKKALDIYITLYGKKHPEVANTCYLLGAVNKKKKLYRTALKWYQQSIYANLPGQSSASIYDLPQLNNYYNADILLTSLEAKAIAFELLHFKKSLNVKDIKGAIDTYLLCDELIAIIRRRRLNESDKLKLSTIARHVYENGVRLSLIMSEQSIRRNRYLNLAFDFMERSKASVLLEAITETKAKQFAGIPEELQLLEDSLRDEISYLERVIASDQSKETKDLLFLYQLEYRNFIDRLERDYPKYYDLKYRTSRVALSEIQSRLSPNVTLISYFVGETINDDSTNHHIFIFLVSKNKVKLTMLNRPKDFNRMVFGLRNSLKYNLRNIIDQSSRSLYQLLIPEIPAKTENLIILADGLLSTIPFEVLKNDRYLIEDYSISYDYSATLFIQRNKESMEEKMEILLVAPVEFDEMGLTRLPGSKQEVSSLKYSFVSKGRIPEVRIGSNASEAKLKTTKLDKYQIIHFATHGLVNESKPALSRIFLKSGNKEDGKLYTGEIYNLKIDADLVSLSACETGLGKVQKGEGVLGLARALQYAGAKNSLVSLWSVSDSSTAQLMDNFYNEYILNPTSGYTYALRDSKIKLINSESFSSPYYWSPFILVGQ